MSTVVSEVMRPVAPAEPDASYRKIVQCLAAQRIGALPIVASDGQVIGVVSEADLLRLRTRHDARDRVAPHWYRRHGGRAPTTPAAPTARSLMTAPAITVRGDETVRHAIALAEDADVKQLPVVDAAGRILGLITRAEMMSEELLRPDDEIRTEIIDQILAESLCVDPACIEVTVRDGVVSLVGQLDVAALVTELLYFVERVPGVIGIDDRLSVRHADLPSST